MSWFGSFFPLRWPFGGSGEHVVTPGPWCVCAGSVDPMFGDPGDAPSTEGGLPAGVVGTVEAFTVAGSVHQDGAEAAAIEQDGAVRGSAEPQLEAGSIGCCEGG